MEPSGAENKPTPSRWPVSEMLLRGTFGTETVVERRLVARNKLMGALVFVAVMAEYMHPTAITKTIALLLTAALCTYYAWEKRKYFLSLDELPQRIELEGMAWAYSIGVLAALWLGSVGYVISLRWPVTEKLLSPAPYFLLAIVLALVKGIYRYVASRRY